MLNFSDFLFGKNKQFNVSLDSQKLPSLFHNFIDQEINVSNDQELHLAS